MLASVFGLFTAFIKAMFALAGAIGMTGARVVHQAGHAGSLRSAIFAGVVRVLIVVD
jgi:hypothetical protein